MKETIEEERYYSSVPMSRKSIKIDELLNKNGMCVAKRFALSL